ncbi:S1 family peptidase [Corallococcus aberystwythensis]|uniref:Peptidase S1 domain-containing protein n=1 Tax=Corallococcus aberystwythensis TaxID=2316722 RepID=A0A3A8PPW1_9BACT|nr:trypsin-like serine protease [Corallococcus aberystwythensis]RKH54542.1 hypothetical protein D7W81_38210 [Corallococcus aberystwythensis]
MSSSVAKRLYVLLCVALGFGCSTESEPDTFVSQSNRVYNGNVATNDYPEVAMVHAGNALCTGTLIDSSTVLTAAHCLDNGPAISSISVAFDVPGIGRVLYSASGYELHPDYDMDYLLGIVVSSHHDTALIYLSTPAPYPLAKLISPSEESAWISDGTFAWAVGYGENNLGGGWNSTGVKVQGVGYVSNVKDWIIRVDGLPGSACAGDSGGPFFSYVGNTRKQVGVLSWGVPSCESWNKYARLVLDLDWIQARADLPCDSGKSCADRCGDGTCDMNYESIYDCPYDCAYTVDGDGFCSIALGERTSLNPADCYCGDSICDDDENSLDGYTSCPEDCYYSGGEAECPNGVCEPGENWAWCPQDCH